MKTKTLLITSLLSLAGGSSLMAQVYSQNVVGYVNVPVQANKFQMIANPLNGSANNLNSILTNGITDGALLYKFSGNGFANPSVFIDGYGWDPDATLAPGEGAFFISPGNDTLTFVGEVAQGSLSNPVPAGFSLKASQVPQAASLTALGFPAGDGDLVYRFNAASQSYEAPVSYIDGYGWDPGDPQGPVVSVGESFFAFRQTANGSANWVRNFTVQ
jgi:hypothetical protein